MKYIQQIIVMQLDFKFISTSNKALMNNSRIFYFQ